jgi:NhaA family Na+:H+ antiporter
LLFVAFNAAAGNEARGWAIPMATDIAFALGVLALLGPRVPRGARVFLLTLAVVDDIGAVIVIAVFHSRGFDATWFLGGIGVVAAILVLRRVGVMAPWVYLVPGVVLWVCAHESGVHATIAGVVLGFLTPGVRGSGRGPLERIESTVHPWSSFVVVPLFALANAGIVLSASSLDRAATSTIASCSGW